MPTDTGAAATSPPAAAGETPTQTPPPPPAGDPTQTPPAAGDPPADPAAAPTAPTGDPAAPPAEPPAPAAPASYTLTVPDEVQPLFSAEARTSFEEMARRAKLPNEDAQAALDEHLAILQQQAATFAEVTRADPDYGGPKLDETRRLAQRAIDAVRPVGHPRRASFLRFINAGGANNHIEAVSYFADLGRMLGEDSPGHTASSEPAKTVEDKLYTHPSSKKLEEQARRR